MTLSATLRRRIGLEPLEAVSSSGASNLADGISFIALPLIAVQLTDSPALVAGVVFAGRVPWLLFVLIAGAQAHRLDRRRTMLTIQLLRVLIIGVLAWLRRSSTLRRSR